MLMLLIVFEVLVDLKPKNRKMSGPLPELFGKRTDLFFWLS